MCGALPFLKTPINAGEIDAAAVTRLSVGYYNLTHPSQEFAILPPDEADHDLVWNAAVGIENLMISSSLRSMRRLIAFVQRV
jgi:hypothetical protein